MAKEVTQVKCLVWLTRPKSSVRECGSCCNSEHAKCGRVTWGCDVPTQCSTPGTDRASGRAHAAEAVLVGLQAQAPSPAPLPYPQSGAKAATSFIRSAGSEEHVTEGCGESARGLPRAGVFTMFALYDYFYERLRARGISIQFCFPQG